MNLELNLYTAAIKLGIDRMKDGITYREMVEHFNAVGNRIEPSFEPYFQVWFYNSFFLEKVHPIVNNQFKSNVETNPNYLDQQDDKRATLTAEAYFQYLDYVEIRQANKNAKDATMWAIIAIAVSVGMAIVQICIALAKN